MPIDHAARNAQVARVIEHITPALMVWVSPDSNRRVSFAFTLTDDKRDPLEVQRDDSEESTVRVIVGASVFAPELPRAGQVFTDPAGNVYRIQKRLSPPFAPSAVYRCGVSLA